MVNLHLGEYSWHQRGERYADERLAAFWRGGGEFRFTSKQKSKEKQNFASPLEVNAEAEGC